MNKQNVWVGVLVTAAVLLFGVGLFLIGNQHKAFRRHTDFYTELMNLDGIAKGAKVRVDGMEAGQVQEVVIPSSPAHKFRIKMTLEDRLRGLVRADSMVSVETEGLVGDKFLLIRDGSDRAPEASANATIASKEPFEIGKMLEQANGLLLQARGTITDVQGQMDGALEAVTKTVNTANGVVTDVSRGKGAAGLLLEDPETAANVRQAVLHTRTATESLDATARQVNTMVADAQQRQLVAKVDDTLNNTKHATEQLEQSSQQVHATLTSALAEDQYGQDAGVNLRQSLTSTSRATGNLAEDTESLKHEFFFKGFFKKRGYYNLDRLPVEPYRDGKLLGKVAESRQWMPTGMLFAENADGTEALTATGRTELDEAASRIENLYDEPLIVEGYADTGTTGRMLVVSRQRALLVRGYLQTKFRLAPQDTGIVGLSAIAPEASGKRSWDGVCLVHLQARK